MSSSSMLGANADRNPATLSQCVSAAKSEQCARRTAVEGKEHPLSMSAQKRHGFRPKRSARLPQKKPPIYEHQRKRLK